MKCIHKLAFNEFLEDFYFGIYESENNKEKITFDYNISNIIYEWDGNCSNAFNFLFENKYPLINEINQNFLEEISFDLKIIIFVVTFMKNMIINNFVFSYLKKLSIKYRKYIFGYADYIEDKYISKFFNFNLNNTNEMKLIIYNFRKKVYYIHKNIFNFENQKESEIIEEIKYIINDMDKLKFTSGSLFRDFFSFINFDEMSPYRQIIVVGIFVLILLGIIFLLLHCSKTEDESNQPEDQIEDFFDDITEDKYSIKENKQFDEDKTKENISNKQKVE